jgi:hypothetical protein
MNKVWIAVSLLVLLALIPSAAFASTPVYYCTPDATPPGDGSFDFPWLCSTSAELQTAVSNACHAGYAILYQTVSNGYYRHTVQVDSAGKCIVTTSVFYYGVPPDTGVSLPAPLLIGGTLALGALFLAGGIVIYRKRAA